MASFEIVQSEFGPIKGIHKQLAYDTDCITFQNIPYMKAPIEKLRFREAQPTDKWKEPLDATKEIIEYCPMIPGQAGREDAGILNIFTKNLKPEKLRPVMLWVRLINRS